MALSRGKLFASFLVIYVTCLVIMVARLSASRRADEAAQRDLERKERLERNRERLAAERDGVEHHRIIVVGGGVAGLSATHELSKRCPHNGLRCDITVLEAEDRLGGRAGKRITLGNGYKVSGGASWLHRASEADNAQLLSILKASDVDLISSSYRLLKLFDAERGWVERGGVENALTEAQGLREKAAKLRRELSERGDDDISVTQAKERIGYNAASGAARYHTWLQTEFDDGGDADLVSFLRTKMGHSSRLYEDSQDLIVGDGFESLIDTLSVAAKNIELNSPVASVAVVPFSDSEYEVVVTTTDGRVFRGDQVLITLPLAVLQSGSVTFEPTFPTALAGALDHLDTANYVKVFLRYDIRASVNRWPDGLFYGVVTSEDENLFIINHEQLTKEKQTVIEVHATGKLASELETLDETAACSRVVDSVTAMFDFAFGPAEWYVPGVGCVKTSWKAKPYAQGAFSYYKVGSSVSDRWALTSDMMGAVYFAGEASSPDWYGTVTGAFRSGARVAENMIEDAKDDDWDASVDEVDSVLTPETANASPL